MDDGCQMHYIDEELERDHAEYIFEKQELGTLHNPYDQEIREFTSIEYGDIETLRKSLEENYAGEIGTLAADPLRNAKKPGHRGHCPCKPRGDPGRSSSGDRVLSVGYIYTADRTLQGCGVGYEAFSCRGV